MINSHDYKVVSDNLGEAKAEGNDMYSAMGDMYNHLQNNDVDDTNIAKRELLKAIHNEYELILLNHVYLNDQMFKTVQSLQKHIETHYGPVNNFLSDTGTKVTENFAALSELCGYPIDLSNVE